jgi:DNA polymerase-1
VLDDYRTAHALLRGLPVVEAAKPIYETITTYEQLEWLEKELVNAESFSFDTESPSAEWWKVPVTTYSFCWGYPAKTAVLPIRLHDPEGTPWKLKPLWEDLGKVKDVLRRIFLTDSIKIAHNLKYDFLVTRMFLDIKINGFLFCSQVGHHLVDERPPHDLESLVDTLFGYGDYSYDLREIVGHGKKKKPYDLVPDHILWPYTATDAEGCYRLGLYLMDELKKKPHLWNLYLAESMPAMRELARSEWHGTLISREKVEQLISEYKEEMGTLLGELRTVAGPEFKPSSPQQVAAACKTLGFEKEIADENKSSGVTADKAKLTELSQQTQNPFFGGILRYRGLSKLVSTYLTNVLKDMDALGRTRYSWNQHRTDTGRLSATFYHQIPKLSKEKPRLQAGKVVMRDLFLAPPGYDYIHGDYSQVELRILAVLSQDPEMIRLLSEPGGDLHLATTAEILGIPEKSPGIVITEYGEFQVNAEDNRDALGKGTNFGLAYGSKGFRLVESVQWVDVDGGKHNLTWEMLNEGMERWRKRFNRATLYMEEVIEEAIGNGGTMVNPFGRERRFGRKLREKGAEGNEARRTATNFPIQSTATHITNGTIIRVGEYIMTLVEGGQIPFEDHIYMLLTVHDSVGYASKEYLTPWFMTALREIGERPIPELYDTSFPMDFGVGKTWTLAELNSKGK